jgi:hypothetical protein
MATCAICIEEATIAYTIAPGVAITYCSRHVPRALAQTPHLLSPVVEEPVVEAVAKSTKKKSDPVVEEVVAEEVPADATDS